MIGKTGSVRASCLVAAALMVLAISGASLWGSEIPITLTDQNTTIQAYSQSDAGIASWTVNGAEHLNREWFWFRVGNAGPSNPEQSIDTLTRTANTPLDGNGDGNYDYLYQKFVKSGQFSVALTYTLSGGDITTGDSDLGLQIKIVNTSAQSLNFHFFQMADFNLPGAPNGDTAQIVNANMIEQWNGQQISTVSVSPSPSLTQFDSHPNVYNLLTNSQGDDLNGTAGPVGPGNVEWGFEWNVTLAPGANLLISEDQMLVPEPASLTLLAIGALSLLRKRRKTLSE